MPRSELISLIRCAAFGLAIAAVSSCGEPDGNYDAETPRRAHPQVDKILIISIDAVRPDHLSCYGYPRATTPSIDSVASDGIRFTRAYTQANWTKPSIASLFSGLYQRHHGVVVGSAFIDVDGSVQKGDISFPLPADIPVIAESFRESGFRTGGFVENSHITPAQGFGRGFEVYDREKPANEFIQRWIQTLAASDPVFAFIHLIGPHDPYDRGDKGPFENYRNRFPSFDSNIDFTKLDYKKKKDLTESDIREAVSLYDSELSLFDGEQVAPLLEWLRETGRYDDYLIVVTSDHGEELYEHNGWAHGHSLFEEVIRVPLIVKLPAKLQNEALPGGSQVNEIVELIDLFPTLAALAGVDSPETIDGQNLTAVLLDDRPSDPEAFAIAEYGRSFASHIVGAAIIQRDHKLIERYGVTFGPKLAGFGKESESRVYRILGMLEEELETEESQSIFAQLQALLHHTVGADNAVSQWPSDTVKLSGQEIEELKALGYLDD